MRNNYILELYHTTKIEPLMKADQAHEYLFLRFVSHPAHIIITYFDK